jgi:hypothetical protein
VIWKKKTCPVCENKYSKTARFHELRLETLDGTHELEICEKCADFLDESADVIMKGRSDETLRLREFDQLDQEEPDERHRE